MTTDNQGKTLNLTYSVSEQWLLGEDVSNEKEVSVFLLVGAPFMDCERISFHQEKPSSVSYDVLKTTMVRLERFWFEKFRGHFRAKRVAKMYSLDYILANSAHQTDF